MSKLIDYAIEILTAERDLNLSRLREKGVDLERDTDTRDRERDKEDIDKWTGFIEQINNGIERLTGEAQQLAPTVKLLRKPYNSGNVPDSPDKSDNVGENPNGRYGRSKTPMYPSKCGNGKSLSWCGSCCPDRKNKTCTVINYHKPKEN